MAEKSSNWNFFLILNLGLVVFTVLGGVWMASRQLASNRPSNAISYSHVHPTPASVDARLWEDPFGAWDKVEKEASNIWARGWTELTNGISSIHVRSNLLVVGVMVPGGPYAEDRECRIRARMATVSALGASGYAPEDEQHVSVAKLSWPAPEILTHWIGNNRLQDRERRAELSETNSIQLRLSYERFRKRVFHSWTNQPFAHEKVLVVWLDEDFFRDEPLLRFADFASHVCDTNPMTLVGPRSSSTLRLMIPDESAGRASPLNADLVSSVRTVLTNVTVCLATPTAMDEVLITKARETNSAPRTLLRAILKTNLFADVRNFAATDAQLIQETLEELKLRRIDPIQRSTDHIVLISEWDTFFGRMQSRTFAAQWGRVAAAGVTKSGVLESYLKGEKLPANVHQFVYLRGLDGERSQAQDGAGSRSDQNARRLSPQSIEQLRTWMPEANKAEGPTQFDYVARIGDRIEELNRDLKWKGRERIRAIGILGGDIYDTLLILQALREKFPDVVFFSTELDARLWHPRELRWTRNLVVVSGYGLTLHGDLQRSIAPFRDGNQTAQFAAMLAALGGANLAQDEIVQPRRFEIGALGPIDMSVLPGGKLHPASPGQMGRVEPERKLKLGLAMVFLGATGLALLLWRPLRLLTVDRGQFVAESLWLKSEDVGGPEGSTRLVRKLQQHDDPVAEWLRGYFAFSKPELVNPPAVEEEPDLTMQRHMQFLQWLNERLKTEELVPPHVVRKSGLLDDSVKNDYERQILAANAKGMFLFQRPLTRLRANRELLDAFLERLDQTAPEHAPEIKGSQTLLGGEGSAPVSSTGPDPSMAVMTMRAIPVTSSPRRTPDAGNGNSIPTCLRDQDEIIAAAEARKASRQLSSMRSVRSLWFAAGLTAAIVAFVGLIIAAWRDTWWTTQGEPFSLVSGTSVWPTEFLRFLSLGLALFFIVDGFSRLRTGMWQISRRFCLKVAEASGARTWTVPSSPVPAVEVNITEVWQMYQQMGFAWPRLTRLILPVACYFLLGFGLFVLSGPADAPARGRLAFAIDGILLLSSVTLMIVLVFSTLDAVRLCRWFIEHLTEGRAVYPTYTLKRFSRERFGPKFMEQQAHLLDEWLDVQIVAELTERVGRLVYYPFIVFFLMLLSRNSWWDRWPWPWALVVVLGANLLLCAAGVLLLQKTARKARDMAIQSLEAKSHERSARVAQSPEHHAANEAKLLLEEMRGIRRGAFVPIWENPVLGALLVPSGGTALIELMAYLVGR